MSDLDLLLNQARQAITVLLCPHDSRESYNCLLVLRDIEDKLEKLGMKIDRFTKRSKKD